MQTAAHYGASIQILEEIFNGSPAERALLSWSRNSRFAGSKDRSAIRDIVFDCLRCKESYGAALDKTPRGIALARAFHFDELSQIDGEGYSPSLPSDDELSKLNDQSEFLNCAQEFDFPEFLEFELKNQYGNKLPKIMSAMRERAPVDLRVNVLKTNKKEAIDLLARDLIFVDELPLVGTALRINLNPRKLSQSRAYNYGYVELQDLSSQFVAKMAGAKPNMSVLDYCAGGGGKTLALGMEMRDEGRLDAWDINAGRMKEIPARAARAGVNVRVLKQHPTDQYDLVFVDAPCSGSGAWRRTPDAKWNLTEARVQELCQLQRDVLAQASRHVRKGGRLVYATCSILERENQLQTAQFLANNANFTLTEDRAVRPIEAGDGFYGAVFDKANA